MEEGSSLAKEMAYHKMQSATREAGRPPAPGRHIQLDGMNWLREGLTRTRRRYTMQLGLFALHSIERKGCINYLLVFNLGTPIQHEQSRVLNLPILPLGVRIFLPLKDRFSVRITFVRASASELCVVAYRVL